VSCANSELSSAPGRTGQFDQKQASTEAETERREG
jgi:hypothetical protein